MKNKNQLIRIASLIVFIVAICGLGYSLYSNYVQEHAGDKVDESKVVKKVYKSFENYDFINLKSLNVLSTDVVNNQLDIKYEGKSDLTFKLVDVYNHHIEKEYKAINNELKINFDDVNTLHSRYDLLTTNDSQITKLNIHNDNLTLKSGFGIIDNSGLELSFNKIVVDPREEFKIFFNDLNYYRESIGLKKLSLDSNISKLSEVRTNDEILNKTYNFHYTKTTGFANAALINAGILKSDCGKNLALTLNKYCNVSYKDSHYSINVHNNDFEQITRGILFAHQNLQALKDSPIHNRDLISPLKKVIGGAFALTPKASQLIKDKILMYGPTQDHTDEQASSAYIGNDFAHGIKEQNDLEKNEVEFLNSALSIFLI